MFKRNQIQNTLVLAGFTLASCAVLAQETETTTASVTVQNAFTLLETTPLNFGTITAVGVSGDTSSLILGADGTNNSPTGDPLIRVLIPGTPATYAISGAASFTTLNANLNLDSITLSNAAAPPGNPSFTVGSFTITDGTVTGTVNSAADNVALTTDVNGAMELGIGATLTLPDTGGNTSYIDGAYSGTFILTLQY